MKKVGQEELIRRVKEKHQDNIKVIGQYKNRRTKVLVSCACGYEWEANPEPLAKGHGCPVCAKNKKRTTSEFKSIVKNLVGNEYIVVGEYENKDTPIKMKHNMCGSIFTMTPNAFINGQRCPNERYKKSAKSNTLPVDLVKRDMLTITNGEYEIVGKYLGSSKKTIIKHTKCDKTFTQSPTRIIRGGIGCPYCYSSKGENVIKSYLLEVGIDFKEQVRFEDCRHIRPLPFDFGIYKNDELLYLIEYDGIQHYFPKFGNKQFMNTKRNDKIKTDFCKQKNIPLLRIKYYRTENPMILKEKILEQLKNPLLNKTIPNQAYEETLGRCND